MGYTQQKQRLTSSTKGREGGLNDTKYGIEKGLEDRDDGAENSSDGMEDRGDERSKGVNERRHFALLEAWRNVRSQCLQVERGMLYFCEWWCLDGSCRLRILDSLVKFGEVFQFKRCLKGIAMRGRLWRELYTPYPLHQRQDLELWRR